MIFPAPRPFRFLSGQMCGPTHWFAGPRVSINSGYWRRSEHDSVRSSCRRRAHEAHRIIQPVKHTVSRMIRYRGFEIHVELGQFADLRFDVLDQGRPGPSRCGKARRSNSAPQWPLYPPSGHEKLNGHQGASMSCFVILESDGEAALLSDRVTASHREQ